MKRIGFFMLGFLLLMLVAVGSAFLARPAWAALGANLATNADYSGAPAFIASLVPPNVLILMDNSGSMGIRAYCGTPTFASNATCTETFAATTSYTGLFDKMKCYTYDATNTRFSVSTTTTKTAVNTACGTTEWDGNFLNYVSLRRFDAVKKAMIGGSCLAARAADGTCPTSGSPAQIVLKHQKAFSSAACCRNVATPAVPNDASANGTVGRVPTAVRTAGSTPANLFFIVRGQPTTLAGFFCINESQTFPTSGCTASGGTGFTEQEFAMHVVVDSESSGVVQDLGDKARFGLMEFKGNDGIKVLTPIGWRQSVDFSSTSPVTYNTNKAALIAAVESSFPATNTPLGESVFEGIRYIAQINSAFFPTSYVYPIAFSDSGGASFGNAGAGSLGPAEITALTGTETCPSGYITSACGRDPFFFGSNHSPPWASPSQIVTCCKTFLIIFTDGEPTQDFTSKASLQDFAHGAHGLHCTGGSTTIHTPNGTCNTNTATPASTLLGEHKTDYSSATHHLDDVAYWGHTTDLRQATITYPDGTTESGHDLAGTQNVTVYSFFAFGSISGREILMQAARQGGFEDSNGNNLPDLTSEYDKVNNDTGVLVPDGIPDTYFESQNVDDLQSKLLAAITSILQKAASGTSVSVLATSSTGEGAIYQAYFFPTTFNTVGSTTTEVKWTGFTQGLFIDKFGNLREDYSADGCTGPPDGKLVLKHDCIIKIRLDTATNDVKVDRFKDDGSAAGSTAGDGIADTTSPFATVGIKDVQPIWEGGRRLALTDPGTSCAANAGGVACRRILTWVDISNGGGVGPSAEEFNEFRADRVATLCPYLGGANVLNCNSSVAADKTAALNEATNIINFIRGNQVSGLRDRQLNVVDDAGATVLKVWKLGDIIHSTPVVVGSPRERFDAIYGDSTYTTFFQRYKDRRQVAYVGANDGMLHAFNAGYFTIGDDTSTTGVTEQARFTTTPKQPGTDTNCTALPCDASVATYAFRTDAPKLGAELWAFIPQDLLPHLRWLTSATYDHVYYVDLKPKITDARIFCNSEVTISNCQTGQGASDHPGGWGTVLIGGFRLGGSCTNCTGSKAVPRTVTSDFDGNGSTGDAGDTRVFLSSYFVLDITNPEKDPVLLWTFRDKDLGLTTALPAVVRVNPSSDAKTSSTNEKWYVIFGTGPTHHDAFSTQTAKLFVVDLTRGPHYTDINKTSGSVGGTTCSTSSPCIASNLTSATDRVRAFSTAQASAFMGDVVTLDRDLDFRVDVIYAGSAVCNGTATSTGCPGTGPVWTGALWRLTTNSGDTDPDNWGVSAAPTKLISTFAYSTAQATTCTNASPCKVGPIITAPALTEDDTNKIWVFFGTGRYFSNNDKTNTDIQHFLGVKDCILTGGCTDQSVERNNLFNASNVVVCTDCSPDANVSTDGGATYTGGFDSGVSNLLNNIQSMDGWFTTLPNTQERTLSTATLLGGSLFFTTFIPTSDICVASGSGLLYAVYYQTGTPYKESVLGTTTSGGKTLASRSISLGSGLPSSMAVQIGAQGTGASGTASSSGCAGRVTGFIQASTGVLGQVCGKPALSSWSRMVAWRDL
jgi:type IV pilus assembly protein PilY1